MNDLKELKKEYKENDMEIIVLEKTIDQLHEMKTTLQKRQIEILHLFLNEEA